MKAGLLAAAAFSAAAVAQPHHGHQAFHKRDVETAWYTEIDVVTATAPAAYVYVDQNGQPISEPTSTAVSVVQHENWRGEGQGQHGYTPSAAAPTSTTVVPVVPSAAAPTTATVAPVVPSAAAPTTTTAAAAVVPAISIPAVVSVPSVVVPVASSSAAAAVASSSSSSSGSFAHKLGISYSPYKADGACKDTAEVATDIAALKDYPIIRVYGTDCNQVSNVLAAVNEVSGQKLFLGIFNIATDSLISGQVDVIAKAVNGDWSRIDTVSVGNEYVNSASDQSAAVSTVVSAVASGRALLRTAGFTGPVVIVDTATAILAHPQICQASDYAAANCHAFFDAIATPAIAGPYVLAQAEAVSLACGGKRTVITESGWPSGGQANGLAVPGTSQQAAALSSLEQIFSSDLFLFSAYNDDWKVDFTGSFGAEHYWGVLGNSATS